MSERSFRIIAIAALFHLWSATSARTQQADRLSLADALAYALDHNPQMAAAVARTDRAGADVALAGSGAEAVFTLGASTRLQGPLQEFAIPVGEGRTIKINRALQGSLSAGVVWPLWTGGRVAAATGAARAQFDAAEADLQQATEQLLYEVGIAYYRVLSARSARAEAQAALKRTEENLRAAQVTRTAGALTGATLSGAAAAHRRDKQALAAAESAIVDAEQEFNRWLGRELHAHVELVDEPIALNPPQDSAEATSIALATRPELLALEHRREAARKTIAQARAQRRPIISTMAEAALQSPTDVAEAHQEFLGLQFSWPILNYAAPRAQERRARASVRELELTKRDLEAVVVFQVGEAARRVGDARETVAAARETLRAAEAAAREARVAYEAGAATRQRLVTAQSALEEAQARNAQADNALSTALLGRARALGLIRAMFLARTEEAGR